MYRINVISIIFLCNVWKSLQVLPIDTTGNDVSEDKSKVTEFNTNIDDLRQYLEDLNQMKNDLISSIKTQEKSVITLAKLLDGPGKDFEDAASIKTNVNEKIKSSIKVGKTMIAIIDSIKPYMVEKIEEITTCKSEATTVEDQNICNSMIQDEYATAANNYRFVEVRLSALQSTQHYVQNLLNELTLRLKKPNPHTRLDIIGAYVNNFKTATDKIKMYSNLSQEKKKYIIDKVNEIDALKITSMRILKAIKRFSRAESDSLQAKIKQEYIFMKRTEADIYKIIDTVLHLLDEAQNIINRMMDKFNGTENITVDEIVASLDHVNGIMDDVTFTFTEEGNISKLINVFKLSIERSKKLADKANNFVDNLLSSRNPDLFKPFKKTFDKITVKNVIDSIKLLENSKLELESKFDKLATLVHTGELIFKTLEIVTEKKYKTSKFHEKLLEFGEKIKNQCKTAVDDINDLVVVAKYDDTAFYMSNCLNAQVGGKNPVTDAALINGKIKPTAECKNSFTLLWNLNDKLAKNKLDKAIALVEKKIRQQIQILNISVLSRGFEAIEKDKKTLIDLVEEKNPQAGKFIDAISDEALEAHLVKN